MASVQKLDADSMKKAKDLISLLSESAARLGQMSGQEIGEALQRETKLMEDFEAPFKPGLNPGRFVHFPVGDGCATYLVTEVRARTCKLLHVPGADEWRYPAVNPRTGSCERRIVEQLVRFADLQDKLFNLKGVDTV